MKITQDIQPSEMYSAHVSAPFDEAKKALEEDKYRIISLEENALLRVQQGKDSFVSQNGNLTREGFLILPDNKFYLTKKSPIMGFPKEATQAHRIGSEYFLMDKQVQRALEDSVEVTNREIPTDRFGEDALTVYAFGKQAEVYGLFLKDANNIREMKILLPNPEKEPFARQLWFRYLDDRSDLLGTLRNLPFDNRMRGVRKNFSTGTKG